MTDCIFCKIIKGEIPSSKVYEDDKILAFLDINPANKGHTLIIPKTHYETLNNIPQDILAELIKVVQKISKSVDAKIKPDGYNLLMSNKPAAEQVIPHAHIHVIPRYENDDFKLIWTHKKYEEGEMDEFKDKISKSL